MKPPRKIKVGPLDITVVMAAKGLKVHGDDVWGAYTPREFKIEVEKGQTPSRERVTLIHELLHAIYTETGLKVGDDEEKIVSLFASSLCMVLRDNPDLVR